VTGASALVTEATASSEKNGQMFIGITSDEPVPFLNAFPKLRKLTISFTKSICPSVPPRGTRPQLDGFSRNLIFECI